MTHHLLDRTRTIAKQTLLGVVAILALVAGASMALAADGDGGGGTEETATESTETTEAPANTCPQGEDDHAPEEDEGTEEDDEAAGADTASRDDVVCDETISEPIEDDVPEEDEVEDIEPEAEPVQETVADEGDGEYRNHGDAVSKAAREDCEKGPGHGACVSEVARSDAGKQGQDEPDDDEIEEPGESDPTASAADDERPGKGKGATNGKPAKR